MDMAREGSEVHTVIAIVGRAGRFPGAPTVDELWRLLVEGREGISRFTAQELEQAGVDPALLARPNYVPASGLLAGADGFDAPFFGCTPKEAGLMDPQLRLFLECAWETLESAGCDPRRFAGKIGVFAGSGVPRHWLEHAACGLGATALLEDFRLHMGNPWQFLATATAYKLGLRGPALTLQTACSTSLVAVHTACQSLRSGECDLALAGGVSIHATVPSGYLYEEGGILSPDGRCRPFDRAARGTVPASGVALVALKRLDRALADGDPIHAVIRGSAVNNDGAGKVGFTAPSVDGQREVIAQAHAAAGVAPESIGYVEAHGTATRLGDLIEVEALRLALGASGERAPCALGSLKSNLGHLDAAAGVAGLIKASLVLEHRLIPATLHFEEANPELGLPHGRCFVNRANLPWTADAPRRAAVSSFGIGGTNAHVVLEEAPVAAPPRAGGPGGAELIVLSARSPSALEAMAGRLAEHLRAHPSLPLADVAHTLREARTAFEHRRAVVCRDTAAAAAALAAPGAGRRAAPDHRLVFMYPGMGTQRVGMGEALYREQPVYAAALDRCARIFERELGCDLRGLVFVPPDRRDAAAAVLRWPSVNMAAIFSTEVALTELLSSWGLRPAAAIGHSLGEYAAAWIAGVLSLEDAAALVALRGRLCDRMPPSGMLAVPLGERELGVLETGLALAAVNGPGQCVVSGALEVLEVLEARLARRGVPARRLPVAAGMHSPLVEPAMAPLAERAARVTLRPPEIPVISNVTGDWLGERDALDPAYWARHLRRTVRFADGIGRVLARPDGLLVEVGPGRTLQALVLLQPRGSEDRIISGGLPTGDDDTAALLSTVGELWSAGVDVDWRAIFGAERRRRVPLPGYPFERRRYTAERRAQSRTAGALAEEIAAPAPTTAPPRPIVDELADLWRELLGIEALSPESNFFELGGSSLLAVRLIARIQERLGTGLSMHALLEHPTLGGLASAVAGTRPAPAAGRGAASLLVRLADGPPGRDPIFFVQPIGGTAYTYQALARELAVERPVYAFRASGLEPGEPIYSDVPQIADRYVDQLLEIQPRGPYCLGGHSSGGVIAYQMAVALIRRGHQVKRVVQIDTVTPELSRKHDIRSHEDLARLIASLGEISPATVALLEAMQGDARLRGVMLATNVALRCYQPAREPVPLLYLRARERHHLLDEAADAWWRLRTTGTFASHDVAGNHFSCIEPPHVSEVARLIRARLDADANPAVLVVATFRAFLDALQRTDLDRLRQLFWHDEDAVLLGTQDHLKLIGWPEIDRSLQRQCATITALELDVAGDPRVKISGQGGDVATVTFDQIDLEMVINGHEVTMPGIRVSSVLERRAEEWRILHMHWSVPKQEDFGYALPEIGSSAVVPGKAST